MWCCHRGKLIRNPIAIVLDRIISKLSHQVGEGVTRFSVGDKVFGGADGAGVLQIMIRGLI